jgi:SNF2 family DNA or RNA helicase
LTLYIRLLQASTNPSLLLRKIDESQLMSFFGNEEDEEKFNGNQYAERINQEIRFSNEEIEFIRGISNTSKFTKGIELLKSLVGVKKQVVVWGIFVDTLKNIKKELIKNGVKCEVIDGSVTQNEREDLINDFKNDKFQVLITNPHTLAESISLHKNCHDAVYFEYSFNLTHMLQSRDRINRLGLLDGQYTQYYYLMLENSSDAYYNSIDYRTYKRLKEKEEQMIKSIEGTTLSRIDYDDLEDIKKILEKI